MQPGKHEQQPLYDYYLTSHNAKFGGQEPKDDQGIAEFCTLNHGVIFPLMKKSEVNGSNTNEVYKWLKNEKSGLLGLSRIKASLFSLCIHLSYLNMSFSGILRNSWSTRTEKL